MVVAVVTVTVVLMAVVGFVFVMVLEVVTAIVSAEHMPEEQRNKWF